MSEQKEILSNKSRNKVFSYLGLAQKAGKIAAGEFLTEGAIKAGKAKLVLVSEDASNNTKKNFIDCADYYKVPVYVFGTKDEIGHALGKEFRASLAVLEDGFARQIVLLFNELELVDQRRR